jgi:predicted nucleic acid-binding protein
MTSTAGRVAVDSSVAVPALDSNHEFHDTAKAALVGRECALSGHATFEAYSVLTRLALPRRVGPAVARQSLRHNFPLQCWLSAEATDALSDELARLRIVGGAVYDALVGAAARENGLVLLTRDARAERTYRALGVAYEVIG